MSEAYDLFSGKYSSEEIQRILEINGRPNSTKKNFLPFYKKSATENGPTWAEKKEVLISSNLLVRALFNQWLHSLPCLKGLSAGVWVLGSQVPIAWFEVRTDSEFPSVLLHARSEKADIHETLYDIDGSHGLLHEMGVHLGPRELLEEGQGSRGHLRDHNWH